MQDVCPHCLAPLGPELTEEASAPALLAGAEEVFRAWVAAFNERDLDGMLLRMNEQVVLHPLRLDGIAREYHGHVEVRAWFRRLDEVGHEHTLWVNEVRPAGGDQALASGEVRQPDGELLTPFWSLARVREARIVALHNYLTDPEIMEQARLGGV
jgi:ketosteroid isomerase-like protein